MSDECEFMTLKQVATKLGASEQLVRSQDIPKYKLGRSVRYRKTEVEAFIEQARQG